MSAVFNLPSFFLFFSSCSSEVETRRGTYRIFGYRLHDSDTSFPRGSNHEKYCFYTTWLLAVQKKQIWFTRDSRRRYLDRHTLHNAGTLVVKNPFFLLVHSCDVIMFYVWLSERSVLRDWIYGRNPEVLYYYWQTHHSQDANVDSRCVCLQELLYHIRHVSSCFFLRVSRHHNLRHGKVRRRYRKVRKLHYLRDFKISKYIEYTCNV